ncbi:phosphoribosyl-ATP diphosphatase [Lachnospiraceae bacterium 46-61]
MDNKEVLYQLYDIISDRKINPKQGSYTNYLFEKGLDKILKKVGEEATETIIAAKNNDKNEVIYELSDLLYHISVLLSEKQITWDDVFEELKKRELKESNLKQFHERTEI